MLTVTEHRGLNVTDWAMYGVMRDRVGASLRGLVKRGTLLSMEAAAGGLRWELAPVV